MSESRQILAEQESNYGATPTSEQPGGFQPISESGGGFWSKVSRLCDCVMPVDQGKQPGGLFSRRHVLALMAFLGFCNVYAMRVNLTVAIGYMTRNTTHLRTGETIVREFNWSPMSKAEILGSFFYGYFLTQLPGGWLAQRVGGRVVFGVGVLATAFLTFLTPPVAHMGKLLLILLRVGEGMFEGVTYPAMHAMWSHWAPPAEKTKLATFAFSGSYFGTVISLPLSAWLAEHWGWPSIFHIFGLFALLWCMAWFKLIAETPATDRSISREEAEYIQQSIGFNYEQVKFDEPPWRQIALSKPTWAISIAHFCSNWGFYTMLTYLPKFMNDVMDFSLEQASFLTALPYLMMGSILLVSGQIADYLRSERNMPTGYVRRVFGSGALVAQAVLTIMAAHTPNVPLAVLFITCAIGFGGFAWAGFSVNHLDIAPQYASLLMGVSNTFATLPGMVSPLIVGAIVEDGTAWEWRFVFYICSIIYLIGAIFYWFWASGDLQFWAALPEMHSHDNVGVGEDDRQQSTGAAAE